MRHFPVKKLMERVAISRFNLQFGQAKGLTIDCRLQFNTMQSLKGFLTKTGLKSVSKLSLNTNYFVGDI